jgi:hypothetical protein
MLVRRAKGEGVATWMSTTTMFSSCQSTTRYNDGRELQSLVSPLSLHLPPPLVPSIKKVEGPWRRKERYHGRASDRENIRDKYQ